MTVYYNEFDPYAAQMLRNLIQAGHIAPGYVDERSITDVTPADLAGYTQCHFFAGVGVWSHALRGAGWSDETPVWTGSCPCQPFSAAGAGAAFADKRHLWPHFHWLIEQCKPATVLGEQVASKDAEPWLDLVQADMEAMGYAFGAVAFPAASVGAPHIRDRLYWAGHASSPRLERHAWDGGAAGWQGQAGSIATPSVLGRLADTKLQQRPDGQRPIGPEHETRGREQGAAEVAGLCGDNRLADPDLQCEGPADNTERFGNFSGQGQNCRPSPTNGHWRDADWLLCRDGKWRPVEPGTFPLAHGLTSRVGRLRAYGNAICAPQAQLFIEAVMEATDP